MKNVIISITGAQNLSQIKQPEDVIELITEGEYKFEGDGGELSYMESELTGMEGTKTSLIFSPTEIVLSREGTLTSRMVFKEGIKNTFLYDTPYGSATMGLDTRKIRTNFGPRGGDMEIDYVIDFDNLQVGRNKFRVTVREQGGAH